MYKRHNLNDAWEPAKDAYGHKTNLLYQLIFRKRKILPSRRIQLSEFEKTTTGNPSNLN